MSRSQAWAVQVVSRDMAGNLLVDKQEIIYADNETTARVEGAEQIGVPPNKVIVTAIPGSEAPTDDELRAEQAEIREQTESTPDYMSDIPRAT